MPHDDRKALSALLDLSRALLGASSSSQVEAILARLSRELLDARYSVYLRYRPDLDALVITETFGDSQREVGFMLPRGQGVSWQAMLGDQPVLRLHSGQLPLGALTVPGSPQQSLLYAPLRTPTGECLGLLTLGRVGEEFGPEEEDLLATFANTGIVALQAVQKLERDAADREAVLLALGLALEARDFETQGHTERSVRLAAQLGSWLDLGQSELEALRQGAYLHDLGKLALSDGILHKPGPLNPEERQVVEQHVLIGEGLVRRISTVHEGALAVIRSHHERWDGQGYPDGLAGEAIPLLARIFAVIDVYDALISVRPYHAPRSPVEALDYLRAEAGRQFDPLVVYAFEDMLQTQWKRHTHHLHQDIPERRCEA